MFALARTLRRLTKNRSERAFRASRATDRSRNAVFVKLVRVKMVPEGSLERLESHLGSLPVALGALLGRSWALLGRFWALLGRS